ncbi:hypothetical protein WMY93_019158 [Mugilogobius chulae]|uniref:Uncharacterized protein n=1 Tax=Mugilogobius chulae TaxID=88201 RepID=A0AAW0NDD7_9GOBI
MFLTVTSPVDARLFLAFPNDSGDVSPSFDRLQLLDDGSDLVQRFIHDPYATTFGGFSKVTNFFRAALKPPETLHSRNPGDPNHPRQISEDEPEFELITCVRMDLH